MILAGRKYPCRVARKCWGDHDHLFVDYQRRPVHSVSASHQAGAEAEDHQPQPAVAVQLGRLSADQCVQRKRDNDQGKGRFHAALVAAGEQPKTQRNAEDGWQQQPACRLSDVSSASPAQ